MRNSSDKRRKQEDNNEFRFLQTCRHRLPCDSLRKGRDIRADMQKLLLENEGVEVHFTSDGWQVDLKKDGWHNTIEEALRFQEIFKTQNI